jgi:hypothetical protein
MVSDAAVFLFARAAALDAKGDHAGAEHSLEEALIASPDWPEALLNLGVSYLRSGDIHGAEPLIRRALALRPSDPIIAHNLGVLLLSSGRYAEGFPFFEARTLVPGARPKPALPFPEWKGEDLRGRHLILWPEQGFGDQIQYSRFISMLKSLGSEVTIVCEPSLERLFSTSFDVSVIPASGRISLPGANYWSFGWSIPLHIGTTLETIPNAPYIRSSGSRIPSDSARIGLAVSGNPQHQNDRYRSMPAEAVLRLKAVLPFSCSLAPSDTGACDFAETAAIIEGLDLVIAVDTAVAHLAGAMGKEVWVMLPHRGTDWRWMRDVSTTPWYPTARLFRQDATGKWDSVIQQIHDAFLLSSPAQ